MILYAEKIRKEYRTGKKGRKVTALSEMSLSLPPKSLTLIRGRSGSGKSTLLQILGGLVQPDGGRVFYGELDLYGMGDGKRSAFLAANRGYVAQGSSSLKTMSVLDNVLYPALLAGADKRERALALLEEMGLCSLARSLPAGLSGGEQKRMVIARALLMEPGVLLADEPTGDLDEANARHVYGLLRKAADAGAAVVMASHDEAAGAFADRQLTLRSGELI